MSDQNPTNITVPAEAGQPSPAAESSHTPRRRRVVTVVLAAAVVALAAAIASVVFVVAQPTALEQAGAACSGTKPLLLLVDAEADKDTDVSDSDFAEYFDGVVSVEDGGTTLIVATKPTDDDLLGMSTLALGCVEEQLKMPTWLQESIGSTRALDGRQNAEWDRYTAQWGYHPDNGLKLIIVQR